MKTNLLSLKTALPTEERGLARDAVRLLVSDIGTDRLAHAQFRDIGRFLRRGDVLVVNTSSTLPAALDIRLPDGSPGRLHVSTRQKNAEWVVEIRAVAGTATRRFHGVQPGDTFELPGGATATVRAPFYPEHTRAGHLHLWVAQFRLPAPMPDYLRHHGTPIRYDRLEAAYPPAYYQTIFGREPGSMEMPSAGRAFTAALVNRLIVQGVQFVPVLLHTGVSSLEHDERPYPEFYRVGETSAGMLNLAKREGRRVIAVGTTAVRAVESATGKDGRLQSGEGWTNLFVTPERGLYTINGILSGFHEPSASHLQMLETLTGRAHLEVCYTAAAAEGYHWHEFGDLHLMLTA